MSLNAGEFTLLSIQELATRDAPKIYRPHTTAKPKPFDWDALTPSCKDCGTRTGQVNAHNGLCPTCDPTAPVIPVPVKVTKVPRVARAKRVPGEPIRRGRHADPYDTAAAIEGYLGGMTISHIAEVLGIRYERVRAGLLTAGIQLRDDRSRRWSETYCDHGLPYVGRDCEPCIETRRTKRLTGRQRGGMVPNTRNPIDEQLVLAEYQRGCTSPQLAERFGVTAKRIRDAVVRNGGTLRDDRAGNSGSQPKIYDAEVVDQVRDLYLQQQLTQTQVGVRLGLSTKVIQNIMARNKIPARAAANELSKAGYGHPIKINPDQHPNIINRYQGGEPALAIATSFDCSITAIYYILNKHGIERHGNRPGVPGHDGAAGLKAEIADLGVPIRDIKAWALDQHLIFEIAPGIPPRRVFDAYVQAHLQDGAA